MSFRLLDLFSGAGGGAKGYHQAGFEVTGIDCRPQPRYPYAFVQADALAYLAAYGHEYDAIHASPPCQKYCALRHLSKKDHPDLIPQTRELLHRIGRPFVIENVPGAPLVSPMTLCGTMFGLRTDCGAELRRHRLFETNWPLMCGLKCRHYQSELPCTISVHGNSGGSSRRDGYDPTIAGHTAEDRRGTVIRVYGERPKNGSERSIRQAEKRTICVNGTGQPTEGRSTITVTGSTAKHEIGTNRTLRKGGVEPRPVVRKCFPVSAARVAMGIDWMTMKELSQAIPPAYTFFIGPQLWQWLIVERREAAA